MLKRDAKITLLTFTYCLRKKLAEIRLRLPQNHKFLSSFVVASVFTGEADLVRIDAIFQFLTARIGTIPGNEGKRR